MQDTWLRLQMNMKMKTYDALITPDWGGEDDETKSRSGVEKGRCSGASIVANRYRLYSER